jgi:hypothetical protein
MLSDIVTAALAPLPGITVAGRVNNSKNLAIEIRLANAEAVITQAVEPHKADQFLQLLQTFPELKVVAIDSAGNEGFLHQLRPWSLRLTELSADVLVGALTGASEKRH